MLRLAHAGCSWHMLRVACKCCFQLANVACLPGIVGVSLGMPDLHAGYGFAIGNIAATDLDDPEAVVSPGGVGFDINCGVRLLRTNLTKEDVCGTGLHKLADRLYRSIPAGVGSGKVRELTRKELDRVLEEGMGWCKRQGLCWASDLRRCEESGCFAGADAKKVSARAKKRGLAQSGSLGSGNHYLEVQVVDRVYDSKSAEAMGLRERRGPPAGTACRRNQCASPERSAILLDPSQ